MTQTRRPVVCVLDEIHPAVYDYLAERADLRRPKDAANWREEADGLIVRGTRISADDLKAAKRLKVVGKHGAGVDNIDADAAAALGIEVRHTPGVNAPSVADLAIGMALALLRGLERQTTALRNGILLPPAERTGFELAELTAGIVGLGNVGRATAQRLVGGFGSTVVGYDPYLAPDAWPQRVRPVATIDELIAESGIIFLHMPLTDETRNMFDREAIARMNEGSFLVNLARGGTVDEAALAEALVSGHLRGAASDVFVSEPKYESPLLSIDGFIATPHMGAQTEASLRRVGTAIADKVLACLAEPAPAGVVA
ncbi:NAD(P)-binding domain-containing protein [Acuticoccus sp. M5D2P5]|uniref:NAD(P)-dependent oxidoreductase n=1 Tax=Acuticoccus kalidii TaxID=2910977 RepID=UPI001F3E0325|nr:NAD(P)-dependent oxidoreductase [Acuticoccus kalidii]MCF3933829.1 NAD(P)-binding domain-containing protein [Acuticoccus kalidii]